MLAQALHAFTFATHHTVCIALLSHHFPGQLRGRGQALYTVIAYGLPGGSGLNAGQVFGILRVAVTGQKVSPPLFESMEIIGREKVLERLKKAVEMLEKM